MVPIWLSSFLRITELLHCSILHFPKYICVLKNDSPLGSLAVSSFLPGQVALRHELQGLSLMYPNDRCSVTNIIRFFCASPIGGWSLRGFSWLGRPLLEEHPSDFHPADDDACAVLWYNFAWIASVKR